MDKDYFFFSPSSAETRSADNALPALDIPAAFRKLLDFFVILPVIIVQCLIFRKA